MVYWSEGGFGAEVIHSVDDAKVGTGKKYVWEDEFSSDEKQSVKSDKEI